MTKMATEKQIAFLKKLINERGIEAEVYLSTQLTAYKAHGLVDLTCQDMSNVIGVVKDIIPLIAKPKAQIDPAVAPGMYMVGENIYKVQKAKTSDNLYAKKLVVTWPEECDGEHSKIIFVYAPGIVATLNPGDRMTLDAAVNFGVLYGTCCNCGKLLTNPESIEAGLGPICAAKFA